jgi:hypothetical protein
LDEEDDRVIVDVIDGATLGQMPEYLHTPVTLEYETNLQNFFDTAPVRRTGGPAGADFDVDRRRPDPAQPDFDGLGADGEEHDVPS